MKILIVGATGATGKLLVEELLNRGHSVKALVRSSDKLSTLLESKEGLSVIKASILDLSKADLMTHIDGCDAVVSCLGHNMSLKGVYGHPRKLVRDATRNLCQAIKASKSKNITKYILMNTAGNSNRDLNEGISWGQKMVVGLVRLLLPPHVDNEMAADYLRKEIGQKDTHIEWSAVRPDALLDEEVVSSYEVYPSPIRSAIFNPGKTSRINVGHFMAELITDQDTWSSWKGKMPVIYNKEENAAI
jgi:NAD(P)-dependent dehydrogenase (short-subunit alcohol dehydrogenase family)